MGTIRTWYSILNGSYNPKTQPVHYLDAFSRWLVRHSLCRINLLHLPVVHNELILDKKVLR